MVAIRCVAIYWFNAKRITIDSHREKGSAKSLYSSGPVRVQEHSKNIVSGSGSIPAKIPFLVMFSVWVQFDTLIKADIVAESYVYIQMWPSIH